MKRQAPHETQQPQLQPEQPAQARQALQPPTAQPLHPGTRAPCPLLRTVPTPRTVLLRTVRSAQPPRRTSLGELLAGLKVFSVEDEKRPQADVRDFLFAKIDLRTRDVIRQRHVWYRPNDSRGVRATCQPP